MHTRSLTAGLAGLALLLASSAAAQTLMRGNDTDPATLDHHRTSTVAEGHLIRDLYETLVVSDPDGDVVEGVAESWEVSDDGLTYTFTLRENARWSNGDRVTAEDFVFAFRRIMYPATGAGYASVLYPIRNAEAINTGGMAVDELGARAIDERTLEIALENPTPYFLALLTHQTGAPLHQASVEPSPSWASRAPARASSPWRPPPSTSPSRPRSSSSSPTCRSGSAWRSSSSPTTSTSSAASPTAST
jgi:oligopeptide transport system substrate-binding protein